MILQSLLLLSTFPFWLLKTPVDIRIQSPLYFNRFYFNNHFFILYLLYIIHTQMTQHRKEIFSRY